MYSHQAGLPLEQQDLGIQGKSKQLDNIHLEFETNRLRISLPLDPLTLTDPSTYLSTNGFPFVQVNNVDTLTDSSTYVSTDVIPFLQVDREK